MDTGFGFGKLGVAAFLLAGAATAQPPASPPAMCGGDAGWTIGKKSVDALVTGQEHEVEVGRLVWLQQDMTLRQGGIRLPKEVRVTGRHRNVDYVVTIPAGDHRTMATDMQGVFYFPDAKFEQAAGGRQLSRPSVFIETTTEDLAHPVVRLRFGGSVTQIPMESGSFEYIPCMSATDQVRREVSYGGVAGGTLTLQYREFMNDVVRPAFNETFTFDLANGKDVAFKGVKLRVLSVSNTGLRYVLL